MAFDFKFPDVAEGIHEGVVVKWLVKEGDEVKEDQPVVEVETDKAVVEIPIPKAGFVIKMHAKEGETIHVGNPLITIGAKGEKYVETKTAETKTAQEETKTETVAPSAAPATSGRILATPSTRKFARELGVDLSTVKGSGSGGRITEEDVKKAKEGGATKQVESTTPTKEEKHEEKEELINEGPVERVKITNLRKKIAEKMSKSKFTAPHVTHYDEFEASKLVEVRTKMKEEGAKKGVKLTYLPFIVKAVLKAFKEFPLFNAALDENTNEIVLRKYYNIGISVDTPEGLMVIVIRDADKKDMFQIAKEIVELAAKAKERKATLQELRGSTFTITSLGPRGGILQTPIINFPETAILGSYKLRDEPVVKDGKVVPGKVMGLTVSFDHRIIDGSAAAKFLNEVIKYLNDPEILTK